jgi:hypothetical protein
MITRQQLYHCARAPLQIIGNFCSRKIGSREVTIFIQQMLLRQLLPPYLNCCRCLLFELRLTIRLIQYLKNQQQQQQQQLSLLVASKLG